MNFGISLSISDYLFKTNYIPEDGGDVKLAYPGDENLPKDFFAQIVHGFKPKKKRRLSTSFLANQ